MPALAHGVERRDRNRRTAVSPFTNTAEHLLAELELLRLLLQREVLRLRASGFLTDDRFRGLYVSDEQVDAALRQHYASSANGPAPDKAASALTALDQQISAVRAQIDLRLQQTIAAGVSLPFLHLVKAFSLSPFERNAVIAAVAVEMDLRFETLFSYAQNDVTRKRPTADLILRLHCNSIEEQIHSRVIFSSTGNLFANALLRFAEGSQDRDAAQLARPLRVDERVVEFLLGQSGIDSRLRPFTVCRNFSRPLSELCLPERLLVSLKNALSQENNKRVFYFQGPRGAGKKSAAGALSAKTGRSLLVADLSLSLACDISLDTILSLLTREAALCGANLYLEHAEAIGGNDSAHTRQRAAMLRAIRPAKHLVFVASESGEDELRLAERMWTFDFPIPGFAHRAELWTRAVRETFCPAKDWDSFVLAGKFVLTAGEIYDSCCQASRSAILRGEEVVSMSDLESAARAQSNQNLRRLAQKVDGVSEWKDLVLPPRTIYQLREVCATEKHRHLVHSTWGFARSMALGRGLNVLFHGGSGTGKTTAASILAQELGLDLYKIDLSTVVSKYIGETEKQLSRIFREAKSSNAILFFDEADALFGKRSEVKDAHDRYANTEVAFLLQKMEEYEGITILATNFRKNMDDAFTRRIQFIIEFPFPDATYRQQIWKNLIPPNAPLADDVNFGFLARQFELAGGDIRNAVVAAAFLAAESGGSISMAHFIRAVSRELQKLGRIPSRAEFREYYEFTREQE
jgi:SpoVK/Ycf46/Vps4 family AAA+-type ATPase